LVRAEVARHEIETREMIEGAIGARVGGAGASAVIECARLPGSAAAQVSDRRQLWGRHQLSSLQEGTLARPAEAEHAGSTDRRMPKCTDSLPPQPLAPRSGVFGVEQAGKTVYGESPATIWEPKSARLAPGSRARAGRRGGRRCITQSARMHADNVQLVTLNGPSPADKV